MRGLAEYIMRGSKQATLVVAVTAAIPLLFWFSAAALALVILRRGLRDALSVLVWGTLPALAWALIGDLTPLLVILGSAGLATLLRQRGEWSAVLLAAVPLGVVFALVLLAVLSEPLHALAGQIREMLPEMLSGMNGAVDEVGMARLETLLVPVLAGLMGAVHVTMALVSLMIGRSWQARLYNPGGFRQEFHQVRLSPLVAISLLLVTVLGPQWSQLALVSPVASVPLLIAGLALMHGVIGIKNMGTVWLVAMYVVFVFMAQFVYPLIMFLAFVDSMFDFRARMKPGTGSSGDGDSSSQG
ncbi:MAG TPA: hypothetical protein ENI17_17740 [Pseudomonas xinjiangensis]|uniref:DUF2232 domain-containing protein n=2 Tax=root TaxID=1 RepID=A0A7V1BPE3_9GAMM|nr:hypothetical protein [Halopseudomonas xinjiangensis]HEC49448.1 hypothetical protein [Halopseudomonas xinjiangensis]